MAFHLIWLTRWCWNGGASCKSPNPQMALRSSLCSAGLFQLFRLLFRLFHLFCLFRHVLGRPAVPVRDRVMVSVGIMVRFGVSVRVRVRGLWSNAHLPDAQHIWALPENFTTRCFYVRTDAICSYHGRESLSLTASGILRTCGPVDQPMGILRTENADLVCGLVGKMRTYGPLKLRLFCWTSRIQQFCESTKYCTFMKWMAFCACCRICLTQARFFLLKTFLMHVVIHTIPRSMPSINTAIHTSRVGKLRTHVCQLWQLT